MAAVAEPAAGALARIATCSTWTCCRWPEIELVMRTTDAMREVLARPIASVPALRGTA